MQDSVCPRMTGDQDCPRVLNGGGVEMVRTARAGRLGEGKPGEESVELSLHVRQRLVFQKW